MRGRGGWARTLETDERPPLSKQWIRKESEKYLKISHWDNVSFKSFSGKRKTTEWPQSKQRSLASPSVL